MSDGERNRGEILLLKEGPTFFTFRVIKTFLFLSKDDQE